MEIPEREALPGNRRVQTVVIGAGMAGILTAYFLKKEGVDVVVVEAGRIAGGQTKNTTAKITSQHGLIYHKMMQKAGREKAQNYAMAAEDAVKIYERIIKEEKVECHFKKLPSYLYTLYKSRIGDLEKEAATARELGMKARFVEGRELTELPFEAAGAVCFENQGQFSPLEFIKALSGPLEIYENTKVLSVKGHVVLTDKGEITAENIVFACHYPFPVIPGFYFLRQHQERSYVIALEGYKELDGMYYCADGEGISLRSAGNILLLGGGSRRTGKPGNGMQNCIMAGYSYLQEAAGKYYPALRETARWSAQDCMPHDEIPFIGRFSVYRPYWYVATRFKKWGMTASMVSALIISSRICGKDSPYEKIFSPQRLLFQMGVKNLLADIGESIIGLGRGLFSKKERKCPHMGCRLEWNSEEERWECPCHGSGFDRDGKLLDGPARRDMKK